MSELHIDDFAALFARYLKGAFRYDCDTSELRDVANKLIVQIKARPELATAMVPNPKWGSKTALQHLALVTSAPGADDVLRTLIENKASVNAAYVIKTVAADKGSTGALKQLIAARADVNSATTYNWTPLMSAARLGRVDNVRVLLDAKADPSVRVETSNLMNRLAGKTAWEIACTDLGVSSSELLQQLASLLGPVPPPAPPAPRVDLEAMASVLGDNQKSTSIPRLDQTRASAGDIVTSPVTTATAVDSTRSERTESS